MIVGVTILPKNEVLDSTGRAVEATLRAHGLGAERVRVGKFVRLELDAETEERALARAREIAEFVLHNPLIETYRLEVLAT